MRQMIQCKKCLKDHFDNQPCDRRLRPKSNWDLLYPGAARGPKPPKREVDKAPPRRCAICQELENQGGKLTVIFFVDPIFDARGGRVDRGPQTVHKTCYRALLKHGK